MNSGKWEIDKRSPRVLRSQPPRAFFRLAGDFSERSAAPEKMFHIQYSVISASGGMRACESCLTGKRSSAGTGSEPEIIAVEIELIISLSHGIILSAFS